MIIRIPKVFYDDHIDRELPAPPVVSATSRWYRIDTEHADFGELLNDAEFYADPDGPDGCPDIVAAAKALLTARRKA